MHAELIHYSFKQQLHCTYVEMTNIYAKFSPSNAVFLIHPMPAQCKQNRLLVNSAHGKTPHHTNSLTKQEYNNRK